MIDLEGIEHHPAITEIVDVLCNKTQNTDRGFFQTEAAFFLGKMASNMRATIITKDRGEIPVNVYALALATSGYGKGHSVSIIEEDIMKPFRKRMMDDTFTVIAEKHLWDIANDRAIRNGGDQQDEFNKAEREFQSAGAFPFTFDSATTPAVKQLRHKLLMGGCGAISLQIDEIGSNLIGNVEVLTLFLELFDQGRVKQKLTKNTTDNARMEEVDGKTPTNMLLFGTPAKLFDGGATEEHFYSFLETGYARRCIFGIGQTHKRAHEQMSPAEVYAALTQPSNNQAVNKWSSQFHRLADPAMFGWTMDVPDDVGIQLIEYRIACERYADSLPEHEEIRKAEINHRYFKALKLAGAYAFVDRSSEVEMDHLLSAILLVEESGEAFKSILSRDKNYVKLAKYIADIGEEVTHADLHEALPYYKAGQAARNEQMTLATAWGYKKHIIIKKSFVDGIEFFKGEKLQETDLEQMIISYGDHWAYNYLGERVPFDQLHNLTQAAQDNGEPMHWANHHFRKGHRAEENVLPGFNLVAIDVDGGIALETVHDLMKGYKFMTYTTKRHQLQDTTTGELGEDRFRLIIPINYTLELSTEEYKEFMNSFMLWLPFTTDESANQRAKKWESFSGGSYHYNLEGETLDVLDFIPKTSRNEQYRAQNKELQSLDNLERWFAQRIASGNRNNQMIKYALALVDGGMSLIDVQKQVFAFNKKLNTPLTEDELEKTIMTTVAKRYQRP
jgi:hypothetical protein